MYELMNGETVDLSRISKEAQDYLDGIETDAATGASYFDLELRVKGPAAFTTRQTKGFVTADVIRDPVYRVANDLVARTGIRQGKLAPPRDAKPAELLSVPEAAKLVGTTRQNLNAAIAREALAAEKIGGTYVVKLTDLRAYKDRADKRPAPGRSPEGGITTVSDVLVDLHVRSAKQVTVERARVTTRRGYDGDRRTIHRASVGGRSTMITQNVYSELLDAGAKPKNEKGR
jgi:excisionase family DNA binding protein